MNRLKCVLEFVNLVVVFCFQSKAVHLTFSGHLPIDIILTMLNGRAAVTMYSIILTMLNSRAAVTWYSIVQETSDAEVAYDHTHAACGFTNKLTSSSFQPPLTLTESILVYHRKAPVRIEQYGTQCPSAPHTANPRRSNNL